MTLKHDQIIVVDIEATCWEENTQPAGIPNEIIEVGLCILNTQTFEVSDKTSILVHPVESFISPFCTQLTTITPELVAAQGVSFAEACRQLETAFGSRGMLWCSWGNYDKRLFNQQCKQLGVRYPFSDHHMNVRKVFCQYENHKKFASMPTALSMLDMTMDGTLHRGDDDAWHIGLILSQLLQRHSVKILARYW